MNNKPYFIKIDNINLKDFNIVMLCTGEAMECKKFIATFEPYKKESETKDE